VLFVWKSHFTPKILPALKGHPIFIQNYKFDGLKHYVAIYFNLNIPKNLQSKQPECKNQPIAISGTTAFIGKYSYLLIFPAGSFAMISFSSCSFSTATIPSP